MTDIEALADKAIKRRFNVVALAADYENTVSNKQNERRERLKKIFEGFSGGSPLDAHMREIATRQAELPADLIKEANDRTKGELLRLLAAEAPAATLNDLQIIKFFGDRPFADEIIDERAHTSVFCTLVEAGLIPDPEIDVYPDAIPTDEDNHAELILLNAVLQRVCNKLEIPFKPFVQ